MKNILTISDYSTTAENAVEAAFVFAHKYGCNLHILHNNEPGEKVVYHSQAPSKIGISSKTNQFDNPLEKWQELSQKHSVDFTFVMSNGDLLENVQENIQKEEIDLLIMGSIGIGGKDEYIWGSNTEKVIHAIDCPVLIIKQRMEDYVLDNIVFASSFDAEEKETLEYALKLLSLPKNAKINLLSIDTLSYFKQPGIVVNTAMQEFEKIAEPYEVESFFYQDYSIDSGIRHFLEENKPDLLIMSNKNSSVIKRFIQGSNTIRAVHHANTPVLTIDYK